MNREIKYNEAMNKKIGTALSEARREKKLSYRSAGALVGMTGQALHFYESGRTVVPLPVFVVLARTYGKDPVALLHKVLSD